MSFYNISEKEVLKKLDASSEGLTSDEARHRLNIYGHNHLKEPEPESMLMIFLSQFKSPLVWVLFGAMGISLAVGELTDFYVIGAIVVLNAILGFVQEFRAEKAIEALKKLISLKASVLRDGKQVIVDAGDVVPGDILILNTGDKISADARVLESVNLETQESVLTGESVPERKMVTTISKEVSVADQVNMLFSGTVITDGHGRAVVIATGMSTEIGKIATLIQSTVPESTPLQKTLKVLSEKIGVAVVFIAILVFIVGLLRSQESASALLLTAASLAVAAIPEGLPAVVTVGLSLGVQRLAKKNALIRHLPSVETLGSCTVICSDKTGTLTKNEMTVRKLFVNRAVVDVYGAGYDPKGEFSRNSKEFDLLLKIGALNNNASVSKEGESWQVVGDPTEAALIVSARKAGLVDEALHDAFPRVHEVEFTSERKRMTTVHGFGKKKVAFMKGAAEVVLSLCSKVLVNGTVERLTKAEKDKIVYQNEQFAKGALRVLGFAYKDLTSSDKTDRQFESDMVFVGLQAMIDPPRPEVKTAVDKCKTAGIKVVMITGDHKTTAEAIAKELGIEGKAITGLELDAISDLASEVENIAVYARVNPEHKLKIVSALKAKGHVVAMTGDGVNDAPAIKKADMGIAMGIMGTDVAKEASRMVLADDNFATIVNAIEEGRRVYDNIQKFLAYLFAGNVGEVLIILSSILFGLPLPLVAIQILWINLVTDGLPALALGVDPAEKGSMQRPPRRQGESVFKGVEEYVYLAPLILTALGMVVFEWLLPAGVERAQTVMFSSVVVFELFQALSCRSVRKPIIFEEPFANKWLWLSVFASLLLQVSIVYVPFLQSIFYTVSISLSDWAIVCAVGFAGFVYVELHKFFVKK